MFGLWRGLFQLLFMLSLIQAPVHAAQPNFVFIMADDCTFRDLECYGGQAKTPHMNRLATEGMQFDHCFQNSPMCSPTRHNLYTGLYPFHSGAYPNHTFVPANTRSVVQFLKPAGYRVALSGKTHVSPKSVFDFEYSGKKNNPDMEAIDLLFTECVASKTPFCLFACSNEPHSPWNLGDASQYPPDSIELPPYLVDTPLVRENFSRYLAEITYYDQQVGQILDLIDKHELRDDTLVMVVSEQGNSFPFAKWTCYGNGLQSGMIVRWPGQVKASSSSSAIVEYTDVLPTFLDLAEVAAEGLDGESFRSILLGETNQHRRYTCGQMTTRGIINGTDAYGIRTVRGARYRLIWNLHHEATFENACTQADYFKSMVALAQTGDPSAQRLVHQYYHRPEYELYDCETDPLEMKNLIADPKYADEVERLKAELKRWMESQGDLGRATEENALAHQGRYRDMTADEAYEAWKFGKSKSTKSKRKKQNEKARSQ